MVLLSVGSQAEEWVHGWGPLRAAGNSQRDQCASSVPLMAGPRQGPKRFQLGIQCQTTTPE